MNSHDAALVLGGFCLALAVMAIVDAVSHWVDDLIHREWED